VAEIQALFDRYQKGETCAQIGRSLNVDGKTVGRWFAKAGFPVRNRSQRAAGERNSSWKGGRRLTKDGYLLVWTPDGFILEHRMNMEKHLGRKLLSNEIIHHLNENKLDNRISNLMVCVGNGEHRKQHILKVWSRKYACCSRCKGTDREHCAKGLCTGCYMYFQTIRKRGYETQYDKNGKRIITSKHRKRLSQAALKRYAKLSYI